MWRLLNFSLSACLCLARIVLGVMRLKRSEPIMSCLKTLAPKKHWFIDSVVDSDSCLHMCILSHLYIMCHTEPETSLRGECRVFLSHDPGTKRVSDPITLERLSSRCMACECSCISAGSAGPGRGGKCRSEKESEGSSGRDVLLFWKGCLFLYFLSPESGVD